MQRNLLMLTNLYFAFGSSIYMGTMWSLRFFFYPSWKSMTVAGVFDHFVVPTRAATRFFLVVVPLMFVAIVISVIEEWGAAQFWQALVCLAGLLAETGVGWLLIIPINKRVAAGVAAGAPAALRLDQAALNKLLARWMLLNDVRWVITTLTWVSIMWLLVGKGHLSRAFSF